MRITGGQHRGRKLPTPPRGVRPTTDRVREALFSILGQDLDGVHVLDAFAGSGVLSFEALSRGAASATLVEQNRATASWIKAQARTLGLDVRVVVGRSPGRIPPGSWDLAFVDPPYSVDPGPALEAVAPRVTGLVVVEHDPGRDSPPAPEGFTLDTARTYGSTALSLYRRAGG